MPETRGRLTVRPRPETDRPPVGPGRVLAVVYGFFSLAAAARSAVQLASHASRAPLAYSLSAVAAAIYLTGTVLIVRADRVQGHRRWAVIVCGVELSGVLVIGTVSLAARDQFPDPTLWSQYGSGYGYVPLVLPVLALWWLGAFKRQAGALDRQPSAFSD